MNKTNNVRLLNGSQSASASVLLSRQLIYDGVTKGGVGAPGDAFLISYLKKLMEAIHKYLDDYLGYLTGNLSELPQHILASDVAQIASVFYGLKQTPLLTTVYEEYRGFVNTLISSFQNISFQVSACQNIQSQLQIALQKASILDDITKLKAYIQGLKSSFSLFPEQIVGVPLATIKEPYNTYIKMFGFPPNMVWESDKLGFVEEYLKIQSL